MSEINDGEQAFPCETALKFHKGMSLRDYFAARASEEDIREHQAPWTENQPEREGLWSTMIPDCSREIAKFRYSDAMLKAREAK